MPLLFWYPIIVWSSMVGLALESAQPRRENVPRASTQPRDNAGADS
jgi:hypothetical protein